MGQSQGMGHRLSGSTPRSPFTPTPTLLRFGRTLEGAFARRAPGIQINDPAICTNALPLSYQAWGGLWTIAKAQVIPA